ncbi:MAG TPA: HD domain-containing phosphohydrolase [Blastocatellia bacterium]
MDMSDYNPGARYFWWCAVITGGLLIADSVIRILRLGRTSLLELLALVVIVCLAARRPTLIPGTQTWITPSDLFVFVAALVWGAPAATMVAVADAVVVANAASKRMTSRLGGPAITSISIFVSASLFELGVAALHGFGFFNATALLALLLAFSLLYFAISSFLLAAHMSIKRRVGIMKVWAKYRSMSLTYLAAASAAWFIHMSVSQFGVGSLLGVVPVVAIVLVSCYYYFRQAEEREKAIKRISEIHLATVEALATAIDAKDQVTHDHVYRVQVYACGLGRHFGLTGPQIEALKAGALLHDVGKIAVPDYILNKPGKLTAAEFDKMKIHTVVGAQIMERVNFPYPVVPIVRHHHERWDGKGYPDSLKGEDIPITARVLTVADCFDAIREDRQYRKGMTRDQACQFLRDNAGSQFDPTVVDAFLSNLPAFEEEIAAHKSNQPLLSPTHQAGLSEAAMKAVPAAGLAESESTPEYFAQIASAHSEAAALYEMTEMVSQSFGAEEATERIATQVERAIPYTTCVFYLKDQAGDNLQAIHTFGLNADELRGQSIPLGEGIAGWVALNSRPMCNTDPMLDLERFLPNNSDGYKTTMVYPLTRGEETIGALALYCAELKSYNAGHIQFLESVSRLASTALHNASLQEQVRASVPITPMGATPSGPLPVA